MAIEPERKIEQVLRAYAQKRREEAGDRFELHPATRRLLQAEVTRLRPRIDDSNFWLPLLGRIWLRAGLAVSISLLLGLALWWLHPWEKQPQHFAAKKTTSVSPSTFNSPAPPAIALADESSKKAEATPMRGLKSEARDEKMLREDSSKLAENAKEAAAKLARSATQPARQKTPATAPQSLAKAMDKAESDRSAGIAAPNGREKGVAGGVAGTEEKSLGLDQLKSSSAGAYAYGFKSKGDALQAVPSTNSVAEQNRVAKNLPLTSLAGEVASAPRPETAAPRTDSPAQQQLRSSLSDFSQVSRERFASVTEAENLGRALAVAPPVPLSSFVLERSGNSIRIVDADGSVYEGQLVAKGEGEVKLKQQVDAAKDFGGGAGLGETAARARRMQPAMPQEKAQGQAAPAPAMSFRASGTNVTLKQMVVIQASVSQMAQTELGIKPQGSSSTVSGPAAVAQPSAPPAAAPSVGFALPDSAATNERKQFLFRQAPGGNAQVQFLGTAKIGNNPEVPIKAARVGP